MSFDYSYGSPSKRSRNAFYENMTSIDTNKSKYYFVLIFNQIITYLFV